MKYKYSTKKKSYTAAASLKLLPPAALVYLDFFSLSSYMYIIYIERHPVPGIGIITK